MSLTLNLLEGDVIKKPMIKEGEHITLCYNKDRMVTFYSSVEVKFDHINGVAETLAFLSYNTNIE